MKEIERAYRWICLQKLEWFLPSLPSGEVVWLEGVVSVPAMLILALVACIILQSSADLSTLLVQSIEVAKGHFPQ